MPNSTDRPKTGTMRPIGLAIVIILSLGRFIFAQTADSNSPTLLREGEKAAIAHSSTTTTQTKNSGKSASPSGQVQDGIVNALTVAAVTRVEQKYTSPKGQAAAAAFIDGMNGCDVNADTCTKTQC